MPGTRDPDEGLAVSEESWAEFLAGLPVPAWPVPDRRVRGLIDPGLDTGRPPMSGGPG